MDGDEPGSEVAMYLSDQGLRALQEERLNQLLAQSEQRRMLRQARDAAPRGKRNSGFWKAVLYAALGSLPYGHGKPSYERSSGTEQ